MLKPAIAVTCVCCLAAIARGEPLTLSGQAIGELVAGASVEIDTPIGTTLPVRYLPDGQLYGEARQLALYLGAASDRGRWWVSGNQLCHKWERWFNSEPQCLRLGREGRKIRWWAKDGSTGTAIFKVPQQEITSLAKAAAAPNAGQAASSASGLPKPADASGADLPAPAPASAEAEPKSDATAATAQALAAPANVAPPSRQAEAAQQTEPDPKQATAEPAYVVANVARDDVLNVRSGPSTEFDVIGELEPGARGVLITGVCRSGWCPVQRQTTNGWVNRIYLMLEERIERAANVQGRALDPQTPRPLVRDPVDAPRTCLTTPARALLARIEDKFGPVKLVSTCRPGAVIAGTGRPSRHASGNAVDFDAGGRKAEIVEWLIATHHDGGTMTYANMDHIHVDIGPHFVSIAGGQHWASWRHNERTFPVRLGGQEEAK